MNLFRSVSQKLTGFLLLNNQELVKITKDKKGNFIFYFNNEDGICDAYKRQYNRLK